MCLKAILKYIQKHFYEKQNENRVGAGFKERKHYFVSKLKEEHTFNYLHILEN